MKIVEVVAAVIKKGDEIFITKRGYGEFIDMWEFPGGKIEKGETKEEALHREIMEELELEIDNLKFLTTVDYDYDNFHLTMHCFMCEILGGSLKLNAHNDAKWVHMNELKNQKWVPADILVVKELC
ncbi:MAG: (deoxy)nucleoside triphosphate pyrophosphohydrolase [Clostridium sp.]|uniref:(deoxy)nucleoside triphosphate pyrophosphohydrolase n=1 Tax=Clostridium sp. DSM 8431 TaxID=1761781 RepID=UPI000B7D08AF|nr:(deoxy)nucleoside triphosphate pyrophosphohydrolase [Clostridium sp. DSM 8431]MCR4944785.1 (deoxy)nucleoside triphosphate pyrophosphohydrolase [Clostridium sp.]